MVGGGCGASRSEQSEQKRVEQAVPHHSQSDKYTRARKRVFFARKTPALTTVFQKKKNPAI